MNKESFAFKIHQINKSLYRKAKHT